ncbi:MAG: aromatic ring-hydroxylating oxygenase subunit alpha [Dehalococcoidia bacterium]
MSREQLLAMARHEIENLSKNQITLADDVYRVPAGNYINQERWELEVDRIFKRLPLALGFSCEMREPGQYQSLSVMGNPVLMVRGNDGVMRAFMNMCSHRGAIIAAEGCGEAKGFRCPYHAWSYDLEGRLVSVFDNKNFGDINRSEYGLTPLPCEERAGVVWVTLTPNSNVEIDSFLAGYGEVMEDLGFKDMHVVGRNYLEGPNWKVAYDGYRDLYHIPILHRNSFGPDAAYQPDFFHFGSHCRMISPKNHDRLADLPEEQWTNEMLTPGVWTIFPNCSIAGGSGSGFMFSQMFPGKTPTESFTVQTFLQPGRDDSNDDRAEIEKRMAFLKVVVNEEDYITGKGIQRAIATGAKTHLLFGRNEGGGQQFHKWVDALVHTEDKDVPQLLAAGVK